MAGTITTSTIQNDTSSPPTFRNNSVEIGTLCRAWVNFNGTGTVAIRASFNVSSITDNGTGDYRINFTNAMPASNYATVASMYIPTNSNGWVVSTAAISTSITSVQSNPYAGASRYDSDEVSVAVFI
jgi:hypothetical protein